MKTNKFKEDQALVKLISKANVKYMEVFSKNDILPNTNKMSKIFELMNNNKEFDSIEELRIELNGSRKNTKASFERMYYRFEEKLVNTLFFIDTNSSLFNKREAAYYNCSKRLCLTRILVHKGLIESAFLMAKKTLPISLKFEFTEISLSLCRHLIRFYSTRQLSWNLFEKYMNIFNNLIQTFKAEMITQEFASRLDFMENGRHPLKNSIKRDIKKYDIEAKRFIKTQCSIDILINATRIIYHMYLSDGNYQKFKKWMNVIIDNVVNKKFESTVAIELLIYLKLRLGLIHKDTDEINRAYSDHFINLTQGSYNWFALHLNYFSSLLHCKDYNKCFTLLVNVLNHSAFNKQPNLIKERFYILEAYSYFLIKINKILYSGDKEFRINKYLNQVPEFTKDKAGVNIPIILSQVLFFLAEKKYGRLIDRMDSLDLYVYRYLKNDESFRSQCFIRIISEVIKAGFKKQGSIFRTKKLREKLIAVPLNAYPESADIEIIPYEDLWEMVLELLD